MKNLWFKKVKAGHYLVNGLSSDLNAESYEVHRMDNGWWTITHWKNADRHGVGDTDFRTRKAAIEHLKNMHNI